MLGSHFAVKDCSSLVFEETSSLSLTKMFVEDEVIHSSFQNNKKVFLRDIGKHINVELKDKSATFFVWFKPVKKEESDTFYLSKGNIARVVIHANSISKYQFPILRVAESSPIDSTEERAEEQSKHQRIV